MARVKICGLTREDEIYFADELKPDFIGFVFYEKSKRYISLPEALRLKKLLSPEIKAVGVFLNAEREDIIKIAESGAVDILQLHGGISESFVAEVKEKTRLPVIQAFGVSGKSDIEKADKSPADFVLLDNGAGGTGKAFDHALIKNMSRPFFLAGGLNAENTEEAVKRYSPWCVDVSSGAETDGVKDYGKMKKIIETAHKIKI